MIAACTSNLAGVYESTNRLNEAETSYSESISSYRRLAQLSPADFSLKLASVLNNLGVLLTRKGEAGRARTPQIEALELCRAQLATRGTEAELLLPIFLLNAGNSLAAIGDCKSAEQCHQESSEILRKHLSTHEEIVAPNLARTLSAIAKIQCDNGNLDSSESSYLEALELQRNLERKQPRAYRSDVVMTLYNLGVLYTRLQRLRSAGESLKEALEIQVQINSEEANTGLPMLAKVQSSLGALYYNTGWLKESEAAYVGALGILQKLSVDSPGLFDDDLAKNQRSLAILYANTKQVQKAEPLLLDALKTRKRIAAQTGLAGDELRLILEGLEAIYIHQRRRAAAEKISMELQTLGLRSDVSAISDNPPSEKMTQIEVDKTETVVIGMNPPPGIRLQPGSTVHLITKRGAPPSWNTDVVMNPEDLQRRFQGWVDVSLSSNISQLQEETYYFTTTIQQLGRLDCQLIAKDGKLSDSRAENSAVDMDSEQSLDLITLSSLWVLGGFQLMFTLDWRMQATKTKFRGLQANIDEVKRKFARLRQPLAKMLPGEASSNDFPFPYNAIRVAGSTSWAVNSSTIVSRMDLSNELLGLLKKISSHTGGES